MTFLPEFPLQLDLAARIGLMLVASVALAELLERWTGLPRITGYVIGGMLIGQAGLGVLEPADVSAFRMISEIALGLLMFELGSRTDMGWLRRNPGLLATSLAEAMLTFVAVAVIAEAFGMPRLNAMMIAAICVGTSPAVVVRIVAELRARGQASERLMLLTALNAVYSIVTFKVLLPFAYLEGSSDILSAVLHPVYLLSGSALLGVAAAYLLRWVLRVFGARDSDGFLLVLAAIVLTAAAGRSLALSVPLALLMGGLLLRSSSERLLLFPTHFGTAGGVLVVLLFILSGVEIDLRSVLAGGLVALALVLVRVATKVAAVVLLARPSKLVLRKALLLGLALSPMSSLAILLADLPAAGAPELASQIGSVVMGIVVVMELIGPVICAFALRAAGEAGVSGVAERGDGRGA